MQQALRVLEQHDRGHQHDQEHDYAPLRGQRLGGPSGNAQRGDGDPTQRQQCGDQRQDRDHHQHDDQRQGSHPQLLEREPLILEIQQHDQRHDREIADDADQRADERLSGGIQRGQSGHLTGGGAREAQCRQSRVPPRCRQSRRRAGERHERHDQQYAGEGRQHHVRAGVLRPVVLVLEPSGPHRPCARRAGRPVNQAFQRMVGGRAPDEPVHAAQHGQEDGRRRRERDDGQRRCVAGAAASAWAVEQPP